MSSLSLFFVCALWTIALASGLSLTDQNRQAIVDLHNRARGKEPATNMERMSWDNSLAQQAQRWSDRCVFDHQKSQDWGENLAAETYRDGDDVTAKIKDMFQMWMDEKKYNKRGTFEECCGMQGYNCCHYTQVIWAKTNKVGCGLTFCPSLTGSFYRARDQIYLACYYSPRGNTPAYACDRNGCTYDWRPYLT